MCFCGTVLIGLTGCEDARTPWEMHMDSGELRMQQNRFQEAEDELKTALQEAEKFGEQDNRLPQTLTKLALLYDVQGQYDKAEPLLSRAVDLHKKTLEPNDPELAISLSNLGALYHATKQFDNAKPLFLEALKILEEALG